MARQKLVLLLAIVLSSCGGAAAPAGPAATTGSPPTPTITVLAASSLTDAFNRAARDLKQTDPGLDITFAFGSSSTLATQITNGAPADVFASADEAIMQKVADAKLIEGNATIFAQNRLQIAVASGNPKQIRGLADLARPGTIVVLAAPTVPAGHYALDAFAKAGVTISPASQEVDVRAVLNKVALGEADAGIVYVTDVLSAQGRVAGVDIPEDQQVLARYPVAVLKDARNAPAARAFIGYLLSEPGQRLLGELGFSRP